MITEGTLGMDEKVCPCFVECRQVFDGVNWIKLTLILKNTGIYWSERKLLSKLFPDQSAKARLVQGGTRSVSIGRGVKEGYFLVTDFIKFIQRVSYQKCS